MRHKGKVIVVTGMLVGYRLTSARACHSQLHSLTIPKIRFRSFPARLNAKWRQTPLGTTSCHHLISLEEMGIYSHSPC
jgi:hypothetical protein